MSLPFYASATTILVVDDEQVSRRVAYRTLSEEGFRVLEASTCDETLDALNQAQGRVDLVIIDVVMPECDGVALGRQILDQWPGQRLLYMSAHPAEVLARYGQTTLDVPFLAKPYTRGEILAKVRIGLKRLRTRRRIMVVDDDARIRIAVGKLLANAGHDVVLAENGSEATRLWRAGGADLVILDVYMPDKDGLETLIELRALDRASRIIVMSGAGEGRLNLLPEARMLGAFHTIEKPFSPAAMLALVDSTLEGSEGAKT